MAKKNEVVSFKTEKNEAGETVLIAVYAPSGKPARRSCKLRGKQTSDFDLIGGWQRNCFKKLPKEPEET